MTKHDQLVQTLIHTLELSTTRSMHDWGHYVRNTGLSMPQIGLLMRLYHKGSCDVSDISRYSGVTNAATSQLVDRLVEKLLVERTEDAQDRRVKRLSLTLMGRQLVEASIGERYLWLDELISSLSTTEREDLLKALPPLVEALQQLDISKGKGHPHEPVCVGADLPVSEVLSEKPFMEKEISRRNLIRNKQR
jgi:DNA-binding MarR family transcriptional regulator